MKSNPESPTHFGDEPNNILNEIDTIGFGKLVQNFCTQTDPDGAENFLFEIWICRMLLKNWEVQDLQYEPLEENSPPDFRFFFQGVNYDLQVKRLHNVKNEITKRLFILECRKCLASNPKPWLINFSVSDRFSLQDLNPFFSHIKQSLKNFSPARNWKSHLGEPQYSWPTQGEPLATFSFFEKPNGQGGILPGIIQLSGTPTGLLEELDTAAFRKGVERLLKKSRQSLKRPISSKQTNILVMQAAHPILFADQNLPVVLYDSGGLFCSGNFSKISGLILVPSSSWCLDNHFQGRFFPNSVHPPDVHSVQSLFDGMDIYSKTFLMEKHLKWRDKSFLTNFQPESWVPEAIAGLVEGAKWIDHQISLSDTDQEKVKKGELSFPTREQAKAAAYEMVKRVAWKNWGISEERIQEY
jgi:hypothetical protein